MEIACNVAETSSDALPRIVRHDRGPFSHRPENPFPTSPFRSTAPPGWRPIRNRKRRVPAARVGLFLKSGGVLRCTTCHNRYSRGETAADHDTAVCRQCHGFIRSPGGAGSHTNSVDCMGCHMPKRRTDDAVHVVMTDHYIQRKKPERNLLAPLAERSETYSGEVVPYYPRPLPSTPENEFYLAVAQIRESSNLKEGLSQLTRLIDRYRPQSAGYYFDLAGAGPRGRTRRSHSTKRPPGAGLRHRCLRRDWEAP
jgi:hypothetical protein